MQTKIPPLHKQYTLWIGLGCFLTSVILALCLSPAQDAQRSVPPAETTASTQPSVLQTTPPVIAPTQNPLTPEDFAYEGEYLTCLNMPARLGVDVSYWQGEIDWQQVAHAGMDFAMLRLGYRGTTVGALGQDSFAAANYRGATEAGLQVGGYFFSQATCVEEAIEEAQFALQIIKDWDIQLPIVYDWEYGGADSRTANTDARTLTDCTLAFCRTIEDAGYRPMIYFNEIQSHKNMYLHELTDYDFWLAQYTDAMDYPYQVDMWQYTCEGSVPGIEGNVDINLLFEYE